MAATVRIGILGAARIGPSALIKPAADIKDVQVYGVAARDKAKAEEYAKENGIPKVYATYDELINDPEIDAIYNPLPNGLHFEWTKKCLDAGKPVLLEKPSCNNADEADELFNMAESKNIVLLEALHHRFHPYLHKLRDIVQDGTLGDIVKLKATFHLPPGVVPETDIRFDLNLGGGAIMDLGTYTLSAMRFVMGTEPTVVSAKAEPSKVSEKIDKAMQVELKFGKVEASFSVDFCDERIQSMLMPIEVYGTRGKATLANFVVIKGRKSLAKYVTMEEEADDLTLEIDGKTQTVTDFPDFGGDSSWSTYHYQLQAFVQKLRNEKPFYWMTEEDSIKHAKVIDAIYEKSGLQKRPSYKSP